MIADIVSCNPHLFLGTRLKRLGERMQADVQRALDAAGLNIQPSHCPILAALDRDEALSVGELVEATGVSQPGVTRTLAQLVELGLVDLDQIHRDRRRKRARLTEAGREVVARSHQDVWPRVQKAVEAMCQGLDGPFADQLSALELALDHEPLDRRAAHLATPGPAAGLVLRSWSQDLASQFHDINAEWIEAMFAIEPTDRDVLENPQARIIDRGGDILFVEAEGLGIVGTCALQRTGDGRFELTKMGVRETARGRKAGEFLLRATIARARELGAETLYLLTNARCAPAIHLYEKAGFVHDAGIMTDYGGRYDRCDVAMRYHGAPLALPDIEA